MFQRNGKRGRGRKGKENLIRANFVRDGSCGEVNKLLQLGFLFRSIWNGIGRVGSVGRKQLLLLASVAGVGSISEYSQSSQVQLNVDFRCNYIRNLIRTWKRKKGKRPLAVDVLLWRSWYGLYSYLSREPLSGLVAVVVVKGWWRSKELPGVRRSSRQHAGSSNGHRRFGPFELNP